MLRNRSRSGRGAIRPGVLKMLVAMAVPLLVAGCSLGSADETDDDAVVAEEATPVEVEVGDISAENRLPGSGRWRRGKARATSVELTGAYAGESSIHVGDDVDLFVSTSGAKWRAQVFRMGFYGGRGGRLVWKSEAQPGVEQDGVGYLADTGTHFAKWQKSLTLTSDGWQPGMYLIRVVGSNGYDWLVPLVVKSPDVADRLVLVMSDLTWQAYNTWGDRSSYTGPNGGRVDRARAVSFSRPYANGNGTGKYLAHEDPVVKLVERSGLPVSYVAASDVASEEIDLNGAAGVVFLGHDEYWSVSERAEVTAARDAGVDLAFLGANTMYWRVRLSEDGPQGLPLEIIYKSAGEDPVSGPETTARFRDGPAADPERSLVGQEYECYPATGTYTVTVPDFFAFAGTGVSKGSTVPEIVDVEVDRAYPGDPTPVNLQIVAASPTTCNGAQTTSTTTYYSHSSGAGVFSTGTMGWVLRGLRGAKESQARVFTETVTLNVLRAMIAGRMGDQYPAVANLSDYDLPNFNTTGAA